jgi:hypothetical protein
MFDEFPSRHSADEGKEWRAREKVTGVVRGVENRKLLSFEQMQVRGRDDRSTAGKMLALPSGDDLGDAVGGVAVPERDWRLRIFRV